MTEEYGMNVRSLCPAGEILWTTYYKNNEPIYIITSKIGSREFYFLYPIVNGIRGKRIGKVRSPIEFEMTYLKDFFEKP